MVLAYVLVATHGVDAQKVAKEMTNIAEVDSVHLVQGVYDLVVRVKARDLISLREETLVKMQKVQGVADLMSLVAMDMTRESDNPVKPRKQKK